MLLKPCCKCLSNLPANLDNFYKNSGGKFGLTPRCKPCVNEDNKISHEKRKKKDPEKIRMQGNARAKRHYNKDIEFSRKKQREFQAKKRADPVQRAKINMAKRAGGARMTQNDFDDLFEKQNHRCAICKSNKPNAKHGWNIDHCHTTGNVRFILCAHCNRGLGAFKDNPTLMRYAADILETYQEQADKPVAAIFESKPK